MNGKEGERKGPLINMKRVLFHSGSSTFLPRHFFSCGDGGVHLSSVSSMPDIFQTLVLEIQLS